MDLADRDGAIADASRRRHDANRLRRLERDAGWNVLAHADEDVEHGG